MTDHTTPTPVSASDYSSIQEALHKYLSYGSDGYQSCTLTYPTCDILVSPNTPIPSPNSEQPSLSSSTSVDTHSAGNEEQRTLPCCLVQFLHWLVARLKAFLECLSCGAFKLTAETTPSSAEHQEPPSLIDLTPQGKTPAQTGDIRDVMEENGTIWFSDQHFHFYFSGKNYWQANLIYESAIKDELPFAIVIRDINNEQNSHLDIFAYTLYIGGNHWTLLLIDKKKRTVEYYDSKLNYSDHKNIVKTLQNLAEHLSKKEEGIHYQFICKIKKELQQDSYQCGPWAIYFLEKRIENPDVDFNQLNPAQVDRMIADYRKQIQKKLIT